ncbi:MAG: hypothetical protein KC444_04075 [Nitrosopumilus sp.]|nr:hypothetical protein [Nitrosopumilus sp.]
MKFLILLLVICLFSQSVTPSISYALTHSNTSADVGMYRGVLFNNSGSIDGLGNIIFLNGTEIIKLNENGKISDKFKIKSATEDKRLSQFMTVDEQGNIYVASVNRMTFQWQIESYNSNGDFINEFKTNTIKDKSLSDFAKDTIKGITIDNNGDIFISEGGQLIKKLDKNGNLLLKITTRCPDSGVDADGIKCINPRPNVALHDFFVNTLDSDREGNIYFNKYDSIAKLDSDGIQVLQFNRLGPNGPYPHNSVHGFFVYDKEIYGIYGISLDRFPSDLNGNPIPRYLDRLIGVNLVEGDPRSGIVIPNPEYNQKIKSEDTVQNSDAITSQVLKENKIPDWIKTNADWWSKDQIDDKTFVSGIQYLIKNNIMTVPPTTETISPGTDEGIPTWIKNNAGWWAAGQISDGDFIKGIQYLAEKGILKV